MDTYSRRSAPAKQEIVEGKVLRKTGENQYEVDCDGTIRTVLDARSVKKPPLDTGDLVIVASIGSAGGGRITGVTRANLIEELPENAVIGRFDESYFDEEVYFAK